MQAKPGIEAGIEAKEAPECARATRSPGRQFLGWGSRGRSDVGPQWPIRQTAWGLAGCFDATMGSGPPKCGTFSPETADFTIATSPPPSPVRHRDASTRSLASPRPPLPTRRACSQTSPTMSGLASKQQSLKLFEKLKTKQANKASSAPFASHRTASHRIADPPPPRSASTAARRTRPGPRSPLASTCVSTAPPTTAISASTFPLSGLLTSTVCPCAPPPAPASAS
jgi:hypothetical protein